MVTPPATMDDSQPLPTFMAGMDEWSEAQSVPFWHKKLLREQGLWVAKDLDRYARWMRRGIPEVDTE